MKRINISVLYRYVKTFLYPVRQYRWLFFFSVLICNLIAVAGNCVGVSTDPFLSFLLPIFDCYLLCLAATILNHIWLGWIVCIAEVVLLFSELFTTLFYHAHFNINVVQLILETTGQESSEFLHSALSQSATWNAVLLTGVMAVVAWGICWLSKRSFVKKRTLVFVLFVLVAWSGVRQLSAYTKLIRLSMSETTEVFAQHEKMPHLNTPFVRIAYGVLFNKASSAELNVLVQAVRHTQVSNSQVRCPLIVLVIGESYNKHHSSLYTTHGRNTTPRLKALRAAGNLCVYDNVVTPFNLTSEVFKAMFSTWDEEYGDRWVEHTLFPVVFRRAGYAVHFVTNQFVYNTANFWDMIGGTIFNHPALSEAQFTSRNSQAYTYDGDLLQDIPPLDTLQAVPTLLIVHLYGQHVGYEDRYPASFAHFKAEDCTIPHGGRLGKEICTHYDNATLYNDFVVDSIFRTFADTDAIALYLADHGEEVYDWRNQFERSSDMSAEVAHYQYEIPFMFYMTDQFMQQHGDIAAAVRQSAHRPFISSNLCHLLFSLAGINTPDYKPERDLLSPHYDLHLKRIIRNDVDYDEIIKTLGSER